MTNRDSEGPEGSSPAVAYWTPFVKFLHPGRLGVTGSNSGSVLLVAASIMLAIVGSLALIPLWIYMVRLWSSDQLRVIGATFPLLSLIGVVEVWRRMGWRSRGSFWGLAFVALSIQLSKFVNITPYFQVFQTAYWREAHSGPVLFLYGAGVVLLFGGWKLLRATILPLCLLLCVNPVPRSFNLFFDMPLQILSASTARSFAHLIGLHPTGVQLRMMFTPDFGMMIVPGCNGVRGSITFMYLALIYGYTRRLRLSRLALVTILGLLCGYGMNLLRLCILVLYYRIGLSVHGIQKYGTNVDYGIGTAVFLGATLCFGFLIRRLGPKAEPRLAQLDRIGVPSLTSPQLRKFYLMAFCFIALTFVPILHARDKISGAFSHPVAEQDVEQLLPKSVGLYILVKTYSEQQYSSSGRPTLLFGEYVRPAGTHGTVSHITLGVYLASGFHRVADSKAIQGIRPEWTGTFNGVLASSPSSFGASFYDNGETRQYDIESNCSEKSCSNTMTDYKMLWSSEYAGNVSEKHLPIVVRGEWPDTDPRSSVELRSNFDAEAHYFLNTLDIPSLVAHLGMPLY